MSKEFQIRDGNLIASFDLENEDGDIDFCKLLKVSHGVTNEIGMFVDYIATNKIIGDQSKEIADLEAKLAESEKKNFELVAKINLKEHKPAFCTLANRDCEALGQIAELQKQLAESENQCRECKHLNKKIELNIKNKLMAENCELQEQLAEKEKEISEYIKIVDDLHKQLSDKCDFCDKTKDQDKISFALEQLEQLKKLCQEKFNWWENSEWEGDIYDKSDVSNAYFDIEANIDNQIKAIKGEK